MENTSENLASNLSQLATSLNKTINNQTEQQSSSNSSRSKTIKRLLKESDGQNPMSTTKIRAILPRVQQPQSSQISQLVQNNIPLSQPVLSVPVPQPVLTPQPIRSIQIVQTLTQPIQPAQPITPLTQPIQQSAQPITPLTQPIQQSAQPIQVIRQFQPIQPQGKTISEIHSNQLKQQAIILSQGQSNQPVQVDIEKVNEFTDKILEAKRLLNESKKAEKEADREKQKEELEKKHYNVVKYTRRKSYYQVSNRQKNRLRQQIKGCIADSTHFLKNMGLCLGTVEINPIELDECDFKLKIRPPTSEYDHKEPNVNNLLYFKDKHSMSDHAYAELKSKCYLNVPSIFKLKQRRTEINSLFEIHNNEMGVFMRMKDKLTFRLKLFFERKYSEEDLNDTKKFKDNIIHVKLGADGTNIGRNLKLLNFTFTIINEGPKAKTATGNYTLGIFEIENENHESVRTCLNDLIEEIKNLNQITVCEKTVKIIYYYSGDWKMLAHSAGILGANSKYPCVWCKCCKDDFYNIDQEWSIRDPALGCRTHEEHAAILSHPDNKKILKYGYEKQPIFKDIIPFSRYMIDMLHLFLRISDTLFNLLVKDCSLADNFDMGAISKFDISLYKHMNSLQHFLNEKCNVKFSFIWLAETKKLTWRDLVGPEKIRLFEAFNLAEIMPDHEAYDSVTKIWKDFYEIVEAVKLVKIESNSLKKKTKDWLSLFLTVYNKTTVTPYMHAFVAHLHEFVHLYKDINSFNCQGLEKLNDLSTGQYFKGTNRHDSALHQMMKKRNRMEYLSAFVCEED